jgi:CelD/BcsL family acetyltransferase involved in cellulose biosynthesis
MAISHMSDISYEVIDSYNNVGQALEKEWDDLAIATRGCIYLTCAWSRIWWEFYGKAKTLRIFIFRYKGKLVGVMPIYIEKIRIGFVKTRIARLVGANNPPRVFDLPVIKEYAAAVGEQLMINLIETEKCDLISIGPVSDECEAKKEMFGVVNKMADKLGIIKEVLHSTYTYFDLPDNYDTYLQSLSKKERKNRRYYQNLLAKEPNMRLVVMHEPGEIEAEMSQFFALHSAQWLPQGRLGYFSAWPQAGAFNCRLAVELARLGKTRLIKVTVEGEPILYAYRYIWGDCCYWQTTARAIGEKWDHLRLGTTTPVLSIRNNIEEGIKRIENGLFHYNYKNHLGAKESNAFFLHITGRRMSSRVKYFLCKAVYNFVYLFYYKIWYSRLQPKLPAILKRPIWTFYTRITF